MFMIAFGITALVGVFTSIDGVKFWLTNSLTTLGSNTFRIQNRVSSIQTRGRRMKRKVYPRITYEEAMGFKEHFDESGIVSITGYGNFQSVMRFDRNTTNNNIQILGTDENYVITANYKISEGRNLDPVDVELGKNVIVVGQEVKDKLFPHTSPIGKQVQVEGNYFTVVGLFEEIGQSGMMGGDKVSIIPVSSLRKNFNIPNQSYGINVYTLDPSLMPEKIAEAIGAFRLVRGLKPIDEENFSISKSDTTVESLMENLQVLTGSATLIAIITLLGASIGLMNIMLVSVTERTREIGVRKALGATSKTILFQFLTESITICMLGGLMGILMGVGIGNLIGSYLGSTFLFPLNWTFMGIGISVIVGLASGLYPAWKAAKLDPIESLRHE